MKLQLENDFLTLMDEQSKIHQQKLDDLQKRQKDKMQGMLQRLESDDYQPVTDKKIRSHYHLPSLLKSPIPKKMSLSMSGPNSPMITPTHSKSDEDFNKFLDDRGSPIGSLASDDSFDDRKLSSSKKKKKHESITEEKSLSSSTPNALSLSKEDKKSKKNLNINHQIVLTRRKVLLTALLQLHCLLEKKATQAKNDPIRFLNQKQREKAAKLLHQNWKQSQLNLHVLEVFLILMINHDEKTAKLLFTLLLMIQKMELTLVVQNLFLENHPKMILYNLKKHRKKL